jgi:hypothetical protein
MGREVGALGRHSKWFDILIAAESEPHALSQLYQEYIDVIHTGLELVENDNSLFLEV